MSTPEEVAGMLIQDPTSVMRAVKEVIRTEEMGSFISQIDALKIQVDKLKFELSVLSQESLGWQNRCWYAETALARAQTRSPAPVVIDTSSQEISK